MDVDTKAKQEGRTENTVGLVFCAWKGLFLSFQCTYITKWLDVFNPKSLTLYAEYVLSSFCFLQPVFFEKVVL